jgi:pimeloyl-ACP methyl ester carboxylesterase
MTNNRGVLPPPGDAAIVTMQSLHRPPRPTKKNPFMSMDCLQGRMRAEPSRPPSLALLLTDIGRASAETAMTWQAWPWLSLSTPSDPHPVLVLPGWLTGDSFTSPLRTFLGAKGYAVHGWGAGINFGHWSLLASVLLPKVESLFKTHRQKVSLIGASMGGLFARALARRCPEHVRCVVTLSSSAHGPSRANHVWRAYEMITGQPAETLVVKPPPVPSTSVFSPLDGLTHWRTCLQPETPHSENVPLLCSHHGMVNHPCALYLIADRLAQPQHAWRSFDAPAWWPR